MTDIDMNESQLKEKNFEADIEQWLVTEGGYVKGSQDNYDVARAIDMTLLMDFVATTQPKEWKRYTTLYGDKVEKQLYKVFQDNVSQMGLIHVLRNGISDRGIKLKFFFSRPASELNEDLVWKYQQNVLTETRQFAYSTQNHNTIDMVLSLNGIPIIALELKNQITGQNIENSKRQFREDRDPKEFIFHFNNRILACFGVDLYNVTMTTQLAKEKTFFIPFDQGSNGAGNVGGAGNPPATDGEYVTAYLWKEILRRDMLLSILQRYISVQTTKSIHIVVDKHGKEKEVEEESTRIIFPRYHQQDVVEKLVKDTLEKGPGHNYLIQHSAGSGKSNSIAWLTYRLASLHDSEDKRLFNTVFVITDRRILNKQLQDTILGFEHVEGSIETITDKEPSEKLRTLINDGNASIIVTTLGRFPVIYKEVASNAGKRYAVVVDEAHSSQSGKSAEKLKAALADTDEALREWAELEEISEEQAEKEKDALLEDLLAQGQHGNLSFYAFTATPKPKTLQTFGRLKDTPGPDGEDSFEPFHVYSMQQAIEEEFIRDVLKCYTTYGTSYEIAKNIENDPTYEETPATVAIKRFHDNHEHVIEQKIAIIVEKFREVTLNQMKGRAKAMVVTASRAHAVRYFLAMKQYCEKMGYTDVCPLVAFSGTVKVGENEYTEPKLNATPNRNISEQKLPLYFASELYNILIVAEKYQTGFDEPLLQTMFVDKKLRNVKAVQTLSRLNRSHKDKVDTYVLDFANTPEDIKKSFEPFYTATELISPVDVNYVYAFRNDISQYHLWMEADEDRFADLLKGLAKEKNRLGVLSNFFKPMLDRFEALEEETRFEARGKIKNFIRFYAYMAQIARTFDRDLYKAYLLADYFYRLLPKTPHEHIDLNKQLLLVNSRFDEGETVKITLEGAPTIKGENAGKSSKPGDKTDLLSNIIDKVNIMYQGNFSEADRVIVESIYDKMVTTVQKKLTKQANNNDAKQFEESVFPEIFDEVARKCYMEQMDSFGKLFENSEFYKNVMQQMARVLYENYRSNESAFEFIPGRFKKALIDMVGEEFQELASMTRSPEEAADALVDVITASTIPSLDGANEVLLDSFNRLCCIKKMKLVDKRRHFTTLLTRFEVYLKKLYWLLKGVEMPSKDGGAQATLANGVFAIGCLRTLKHNPDERFAKFDNYLDLLRQMRNDEAHTAPNAQGKELDAAIHVVMTMYFYVATMTVTDLEMADAASYPGRIIQMENAVDNRIAAEKKENK